MSLLLLTFKQIEQLVNYMSFRDLLHDVEKVEERTSVINEMLEYSVGKGNPPLLFTNVVESEGHKAAINVLTRERICSTFDITPGELIDTMAWAMKNPSEPIIIEKDENQRNNSFEDFELKIKWKDFANDLSRQNKENLASILQINEPNLGNDFKITYDVPSNSSKNELREIKGDLLIYLKNIFKNDLIEIDFLVNKSNSKEYFSTPEERFKKLSDLNPNLIKLKKDLKLDL